MNTVSHIDIYSLEEFSRLVKEQPAAKSFRILELNDAIKEELFVHHVTAIYSEVDSDPIFVGFQVYKKNWISLTFLDENGNRLRSEILRRKYQDEESGLFFERVKNKLTISYYQ
jgi:hypothetical protein